METVKNFAEFLNERELPDVQGKILIIMGPPGSGKGTFSTKLAERNGFTHISTGDLIRNSDDKELKAKIAKGEYADDKTMVKMLRKELGKVDDIGFFGNLPLFSAYTDYDREKLIAIMKKLDMKPEEYIEKGSLEADYVNRTSPVKSFRGYGQ